MYLLPVVFMNQQEPIVEWAQNTVGQTYLTLTTSSAILHPIMQVQIEARGYVNHPQYPMQ